MIDVLRPIPTDLRNCVVRLSVHHRNLFTKDDFLGQTSISLQQYPIYDRPQSRSGTATIRICPYLPVCLPTCPHAYTFPSTCTCILACLSAHMPTCLNTYMYMCQHTCLPTFLSLVAI